MIHATHLLYQVAGAPPMPGAAIGVCRICARSGAGLAFETWVAATFMDWDKLRPGEVICHACQFAFDEHSAPLAARLGVELKRISRMRNYSHFVVAGVWTPLSKGAKHQIAQLLLAQPELAVVATSGQKHILFRARPGWWQIEEQTVRPFPVALQFLLGVVEQLYAGGFAKGEIESGRYNDRRILDFGLERWRALEAAIHPHRGSLPLELAIYLAQKDEATEDGDTDRQLQASGTATRTALAGYPERLQEPQPRQNLAAVRGQHSVGRVHRDPQPVRQQSLFEAGDQDCG